MFYKSLKTQTPKADFNIIKDKKYQRRVETNDAQLAVEKEKVEHDYNNCDNSFKLRASYGCCQTNLLALNVSIFNIIVTTSREPKTYMGKFYQRISSFQTSITFTFTL